MGTIWIIALLGFGAVSGLVLPWINFRAVRDLRAETRFLQDRIGALLSLLENKGIAVPDEWKAERPPVPDAAWQAQSAAPAPPIPEPRGERPATEAPEPERGRESGAAPEREAARPAPAGAAAMGLERQFGERLPVWVGGIALALAGFFLVKYSLEQGLLSPAVRVLLGGALGAGMLYAGHWVRGRPAFANGMRIAQALSGAGIAVLYASLFAAASLYRLIPGWAGFLGMAATTGAAVLLSLRHGPPIALLGLVGGFLAPALAGARDPSAAGLFLYLYAVFAGLMAVIGQRGWWLLSIPALLGIFLWVIGWIAAGRAPGDAVWLGLFLLAVSATIVAGTPRREADAGRMPRLAAALNYAGLGGAMLLMGIVAGQAGFGPMEWALFGLFAAGAVCLAYFDDRRYGFAPWVSMAVNAVMLFAWETDDPGAFALTLGAFAAIYAGSGYFLTWRAQRPLLWAGLAGATGLGYYLLAYHALHDRGGFASVPLLWGAAALALAALAVRAAYRVLQQYRGHPRREEMLAVCSVAATALAALAAAVELQREALPVALAAEALAVAWLGGRVSVRALRPLALTLALIFGVLLLPQLGLLSWFAFRSLFAVGFPSFLQEFMPIARWPVLQLGVPALLLMGAAILLRRRGDSPGIWALEAAAAGLTAVMGYYLVRHGFHAGPFDSAAAFALASFPERGTATNTLFALGVACLYAGRRLQRAALSWSGIVLCGLAAFRIAYFDLLLYNPFWTHQGVGGWPLLNALLLPYGLPLAWLWLAGGELARAGWQRGARGAQGLALVLLFALASCNARHFFQGEYLDAGTASNCEIYAYSAAWLLLGLGLLGAGFLRRERTMRYASLAVLLFTVGKVFLYDASELEGLYRVFSFLGLGLSLLGLSYFYARVVFAHDGTAGADPAAGKVT